MTRPGFSESCLQIKIFRTVISRNKLIDDQVDVIFAKHFYPGDFQVLNVKIICLQMEVQIILGSRTSVDLESRAPVHLGHPGESCAENHSFPYSTVRSALTGSFIHCSFSLMCGDPSLQPCCGFGTFVMAFRFKFSYVIRSF